VEIKEVMAEGMVRLSTVVDDYYLFDQTYQRLIGKRYGRIFQIGNRVKVKLIDVNLDRLEIDFELAEMEEVVM
jgi:ribonuclease R